MRNVSSAFRRKLYEDNIRNYQCTVDITLADNTELNTTNADLWQGGLSMEDAVSQDSAFEALGSVAINSVNIILNNIDDVYSAYDFTDAKVVVSVALPGVADVVKLGEFIVDSTDYNGALITLYCLDNMSKFDKPYSESSLSYPATLQTIVTNACTDCGVTLSTTTFPNYTYQIATRPTDDALTYREIISFAATLAGCFARINSNGNLELKWFDTDALAEFEDSIDGGVFDSATPYATGDSVDGGIFNPWNTGDVVDAGTFDTPVDAHYITALSSQNISIEDVVITGIQITTKSDDADVGMETHLYGLEGYVIKIENNPFITATNVSTVGNYLSSQIVGLRFRKATVEHLSDPSIEAGDVAFVWDRKGNVYPILVTSTSFGVGKRQRTTSAAESPLKNSATRFTSATKSYVESLKFAQKEATLREQMEEDLTDAINAKSGMYETRVQEGSSGYIYYLHDKPLLADSAAVLKITSEAVAVTPNYQAQTPTWYGLTVDGNFIANIMSVIGIDFDWGTGGTLVLGGQNNTNGSLTIKNASNVTIGSWDNTGISATVGSIGPWSISTYGLRKDTSATEYFHLDSIEIDARTANGRIYIKPGGNITSIDYTTGDSSMLIWTLDKPSKKVSASLTYNSFNLRHEDHNEDLGYIYLAESTGSLYGAYLHLSRSDDAGSLDYFANNNMLKLTNGTIWLTGSSAKIGINKTYSSDGDAGVLADAAGNIYLVGETNTGSIIYFYYNKSTTATSNITETASGVLTASAYFSAKDYSGSNRQIVTSFSTDGQRVAGFGVSSAYLYISGQWGTAGAGYSNRTITVSSSDVRLKKNIQPSVVYALYLINQIKIREFDWIDGREDSHQKIGMVADEIEKLDSKLVVGGGFDDNGQMNIKSVDTFYLTGYLTKGIQELSRKVEYLEEQIKLLTERS